MFAVEADDRPISPPRIVGVRPIQAGRSIYADIVDYVPFLTPSLADGHYFETRLRPMDQPTRTGRSGCSKSSDDEFERSWRPNGTALDELRADWADCTYPGFRNRPSSSSGLSSSRFSIEKSVMPCLRGLCATHTTRRALSRGFESSMVAAEPKSRSPIFSRWSTTVRISRAMESPCAEPSIGCSIAGS